MNGRLDLADEFLSFRKIAHEKKCKKSIFLIQDKVLPMVLCLIPKELREKVLRDREAQHSSTPNVSVRTVSCCKNAKMARRRVPVYSLQSDPLDPLDPGLPSVVSVGGGSRLMMSS